MYRAKKGMWGGILQNALFIEQYLRDNIPGFINIILIADTKYHIRPPGSLGREIDDIVSGQFGVGNDDGFVVRTHHSGRKELNRLNGSGNTGGINEVANFKGAKQDQKKTRCKVCQ